LCHEAGIEYAVFANEEELTSIVERLSTVEARQNYLHIAQPIIWDRYAPDVITQQYIDLALRHLNAKRNYCRVVFDSLNKGLSWIYSKKVQK
jgi:hypothetical protein